MAATMSRAGLPDNTGQPVGSGEKVWLAHGEPLRAAGLSLQRRRGNDLADRYSWLVSELRSNG
jgi:hypothetical protein